MKIVDKVYCIPEQFFSSNIYAIGEDEIALVDTGVSGLYAPRIFRELERFGLKKENVRKVILTHTHMDHKGGLSKIYRAVKPEVYVHRSAKVNLKRVVRVDEGDQIGVDDFTLNVLYTPGHRVDSICLYEPLRRILFSGDTVFTHGSIGRTDLPTGSADMLLKSLERLTEVDVEFLCPGHMRPVRDGSKHIMAGYNFLKSVM